MRRRIALFMAAVMACLAGCGDRAFSSGDRVLVSKFIYDSNLTQPKRYDVVVFKYPERPIENGVPKNYIKRLWGLPGEIIAILFGRIFVWSPTPGENLPFNDHEDPQIEKENLWQRHYRHVDDNNSLKMFNEGKFKITRKPPDVQLSLRRIVFDNDFQPRDLKDYPRWNPSPGSSWSTGSQGTTFLRTAPENTEEKQVDWLRYRHLTRPWWGGLSSMKDRKPELISDFMDYNGGISEGRLNPNNPDWGHMQPDNNWVGDLMLECDVKVEQPRGEFWMELSKGIHRFRAKFDLSSGLCTLYKIYKPTPASQEQIAELDAKQTRLKGPGNYMVRFANIDARLTVWVDRELPFGDGKEYPPPEIRNLDDPEDAKRPLEEIEKRRGPTENDLQPASIGALGAQVEISHVRLWRDTYYTLHGNSADASPEGEMIVPPLPPAVREDPQHREVAEARARTKAKYDFYHDFWSNPKKWDPFRRPRPKTMYVQPGHFLVLGDNSPQSSDSRDWGTVPERLMLGRALIVYFPLTRAGLIR